MCWESTKSPDLMFFFLLYEEEKNKATAPAEMTMTPSLIDLLGIFTLWQQPIDPGVPMWEFMDDKNTNNRQSHLSKTRELRLVSHLYKHNIFNISKSTILRAWINSRFSETAD